ncbi:hypothetical protein HN446_01885 [bacterium]|nr:hypothetical protein [bacterium]
MNKQKLLFLLSVSIFSCITIKASDWPYGTPQARIKAWGDEARLHRFFAEVAVAQGEFNEANFKRIQAEFAKSLEEFRLQLIYARECSEVDTFSETIARIDGILINYRVN